MKIFFSALLLFVFSLPCKGLSIPESEGPKILQDDGTEVTFLGMLGHWLHNNKNKNQNKKPRYFVVILSSVGCPGCYTFRMHKQDDFIKKFGKNADIYSVDYFLEKTDLTAMALVSALPVKHQEKVRELLLANQKEWLDSSALITALEDLLYKHAVLINSSIRERWNALRMRELDQRQYLDTICKIKYLPYFIVVDRVKKIVIICDTYEVAVQTLEGRL